MVSRLSRRSLPHAQGRSQTLPVETRLGEATVGVEAAPVPRLRPGQLELGQLGPVARLPRPERRVAGGATGGGGGTSGTGGQGGTGTPPPAGTDPGRVTLHRLNRVEYNNTVRDLLGTARTPADDFPIDDRGSGFDNIADVLTLSPLHIDNYYTAAVALVDEALATAVATVETRHLRFGRSGRYLRAHGSRGLRPACVAASGYRSRNRRADGRRQPWPPRRPTPSSRD